MKTFRQYLEDKEYTAFVRDDNGNAEKITRTYPSMKAFKQDLRGNGYRVMSVAPSDEVGTSEWERKLYDNREKRKERKLNRILRGVDAHKYAQEKTKDLRAKYDELWEKYKNLPEDDPRRSELITQVNQAYDEYMSAKNAAEAEYKSQK